MVPLAWHRETCLPAAQQKPQIDMSSFTAIFTCKNRQFLEKYKRKLQNDYCGLPAAIVPRSSHTGKPMLHAVPPPRSSPITALCAPYCKEFRKLRVNPK